MSIPRFTPLYLATILLTAMPASRAVAGTIASVSTFSLPGFSTGSVGPVGSTPAPNNGDDPGASPNVIPFSVFLNSPGGLETEFILQQSGGTTEYRFPQAFINTRNAAWMGFRFELGFGTGTGFVKAGSGGNLRFDVLNGQSTATSPVFTLAMAQPTQLDWTIGSVPLVAPFSFAIDVPDGLERFTLRQTPLVASPVPEPAAFGLAGAALLALIARRRPN